MITEQVGLLVVCDECRSPSGDGEVWFSLEAARKELTAEGWQVQEGRQVCGDCLARQACQEQGHAFTAAQPCPCQGQFAGHAEACRPWRACLRCGLLEDLD